MTNVIPFQRTPVTTEGQETDSDTAQRLPYSFDFVQLGDNMLIDACVPFAVGMKIAQMIVEHAAAADDESKPAKRESGKHAAQR
jgi:hypothetical protein